jgi:hypothetical protein
MYAHFDMNGMLVNLLSISCNFNVYNIDEIFCLVDQFALF